jgi:DnaJ family protein C protein 7
LSVEKDKIKDTLYEKSRGDSLYREGRYKEACGYYARVILVDLECEQIYGNVWETKTMGGRLHAVLFCNRAACLMALKKYEEATKECTAALKIEKCYMKAILRRARCYNRLERYEESIAEYNRWIHAVQEARRNPNFRSSDECPFDRAVDVSEIDFQKSAIERTSVEERRSNAALKARQAEQYHDFQNQRRWDSLTSNSLMCHYAVLQLSLNANQTDVKKAYRKMALKYHPDKNANCEKAADVFRKVQLAYETLSDERSKRKYDVERLRPRC